MSRSLSYDYSSMEEDIALDWGGYHGNDIADASSEELEYEDTKARLVGLIDRMIDQLPLCDGEPIMVSAISAATAIRFIKALPSNRYLPKVAPDGEGDLMLVWEPPVGNCILTVEGSLLHLVDLPGTRNVVHVDSQEFRGERIPVAVLQAIPIRKAV